MNTAVTEQPKRTPGFKKGEGGRQKGAVNKNSRVLKEALMIAAELEGENGNGKGKLVGFLRRVARDDLRAFCSMLTRVIPLQIEGRPEGEAQKEVVYQSVDEVRRELESRGISMEIAFKIMRSADIHDGMNGGGPLIDGEVIDDEDEER